MSTHGFTPCASPSPESGRLVLDLTHCDDDTMSISPPLPVTISSPRAEPVGSTSRLVPQGLVIDLGEQRRRDIKRSDEQEEVERSSPKHRKFPASARTFRSCLSRTVSSPAIELAHATASPGLMTTTTLDPGTTPSAVLLPPRLFTSRSESETLSTRSHRAASLVRPAQPTRRVTFCEKLPSMFPTHPNYDYDRSPHPVVPRLSYRDVLELREMKVEMALVTKRQQGAAGLTNDTLLPSNKAGSLRDAGLGLQTHRDGRPHSPFSLLEDDESIENLPPSPSALTSSFPSSIKLVSRLHEMGEFRPPARERGMGLKVEPTFGLDRIASGDSLRDDFAKHMSGNGDGSVHSLRRKTSGEFAVEESEFQKELRKAREELEAIAVQEARLGMASQLGGAKSNKGEQHSVAMGSSGSSTPLGLGIIRPSPNLSSENVGMGNRSRKSSLASQQGGFDLAGTLDAANGAVPGGLPLERTSFAPVHQSIKSGILNSGNDSEEGSLLFPTKTAAPTTTRPSARISRPTPPPLQSKNAFRPPSPILAPFARSAPIRATTQRSKALGSARPLQQDATAGSIFRPPSPILAPFARSSTLQS